jgi:hypothetical protein
MLLLHLYYRKTDGEYYVRNKTEPGYVIAQRVDWDGDITVSARGKEARFPQSVFDTQFEFIQDVDLYGGIKYKGGPGTGFV